MKSPSKPLSRRATLVALALLLAAPASATRLIPFQARVTDGDGEPLQGVFRVTFTIYDAATGGNALFIESHDDVSVIGGQVNVLLGSLVSLDDPDGVPDTDDAVSFDDDLRPRYLGIKVGEDTNQEMVPRHELVPSFHARLADTTVDGGVGTDQIADGAVTNVKLAADAGVPVGSVILWFGSLDSMPSGFELCDGTFPTTEGALFQRAKPDLRDRFAKGAQADATEPGATGGMNESPELDVAAIALSVEQLPAHSHQVVTTLGAGSHGHGFLAKRCDGDDGGGNPEVNLALGNGGGNALNCPQVIDPSTGGHAHPLDVASEVTGADEAHTHAVPAQDNQPAYVELFYIIRIK